MNEIRSIPKSIRELAISIIKRCINSNLTMRLHKMPSEENIIVDMENIRFGPNGISAEPHLIVRLGEQLIYIKLKQDKIISQEKIDLDELRIKLENGILNEV